MATKKKAPPQPLRLPDGSLTDQGRAATSDAESIFVNVIAFSDTAQAALQALGDGDAVSLAGTITPKAWTDRNGQARPGLDMVAAQVMTAYTVTRKRKAMQPEQHGHKAAAPLREPGEHGYPLDETMDF